MSVCVIFCAARKNKTVTWLRVRRFHTVRIIDFGLIARKHFLCSWSVRGFASK